MRLILIYIALIVIATSCKGKKTATQTTKATTTPTVKANAYIVTAKQLNQRMELPGSIAAFEEVELHADVSGRVTNVYFKEGSYVRKGAPLLKIYDADLQAQLNKLYVQLKTAKKTVERNGMLLKISGVSQQDYDLSVLAVNTINADINIVKTNIAKNTLYAPFSGKIGITNITTGAYLTPQNIVATLKRNNPLKLSFAIPELYGSLLKIGDGVNFTVEGSNNFYYAIVTATENNIDEATRSLKIIANINQIDEQLIIGKFANVSVQFGKTNVALMVPTQSVIPQARYKKVVAVRNGIANLETVTTGYRDSAYVQITSGLQIGDTILTTGLLSTKNGNKVAINSIINN
jgi:membrane fusion protein (multidrug efflux system)